MLQLYSITCKLPIDLFKKNVLIKVARKPYRKNEMYLDSEFHSLHSPCYKSNPKIPWYYYNLHLHDNRVRSSSIHECLHKLVAQAIKDWIHFHFLINDFPFSHISTFVGIPNQFILWKFFLSNSSYYGKCLQDVLQRNTDSNWF